MPRLKFSKLFCTISSSSLKVEHFSLSLDALNRKPPSHPMGLWLMAAFLGGTTPLKVLHFNSASSFFMLAQILNPNCLQLCPCFLFIYCRAVYCCPSCQELFSLHRKWILIVKAQVGLMKSPARLPFPLQEEARCRSISSPSAPCIRRAPCLLALAQHMLGLAMNQGTRGASPAPDNQTESLRAVLGHVPAGCKQTLDLPFPGRLFHSWMPWSGMGFYIVLTCFVLVFGSHDEMASNTPPPLIVLHWRITVRDAEYASM